MRRGVLLFLLITGLILAKPVNVTPDKLIVSPNPPNYSEMPSQEIDMVPIPHHDFVEDIVSIQNESVKNQLLEQVKEDIKSSLKVRIKAVKEIKQECGELIKELGKAVVSGDKEKVSELRALVVNCTEEVKKDLCSDLDERIQELQHVYDMCFSQAVVNISECGGIMERIRELEARRELCNNTYAFPCSFLLNQIAQMRKTLENCTENETCVALRHQFVKFLDDYARHCKPKHVTICSEEIRVLERVRNQLQNGLNGTENETLREQLQERIQVINKLLNDLNKTCNIYPNPCLRAKKLEHVYDVLVNQSNASEVAIAEISARLEILKKLCAEENISVKNITSLKELDELLKEKAEAALETANVSTIVEAVKKIEQEKKKLLKEYVKTKRRLDLVESRLIKKLVVMKDQLIAENETLPPAEIVAKIKGKLIKIVPEGNEVVIHDVVNVTTTGLIYENGTLKTPMGGVIKVLPSEILDKVKTRAEDKIKELKLENQFAPRYRAKIVEKRHLFGLIPWDLEVDKVIDAQTGKLLEENRPWWSFLLF
jgi:hypothetical protein